MTIITNKWLDDQDVLFIMSSTNFIFVVYIKNGFKFYRYFEDIDSVSTVMIRELTALYRKRDTNPKDTDQVVLKKYMSQINVIGNSIIITDGTDIIRVEFVSDFLAKDIYMRIKKRIISGRQVSKWLNDDDVLTVLFETKYIPVLYTSNSKKYYRLFLDVNTIIYITVKELISLYGGVVNLANCAEQINLVDKEIIIDRGTSLLRMTYVSRFIAQEVYYSVIKIITRKAENERLEKSDVYIVP